MNAHTDKPLPQAVDMERATIGAVLMNPSVMSTAAAILPSADDMYDQRHSYIWTEMLTLWATQTPPDLSLVAEGLRRAGKLEQVGGMPYLVDVTEHALASAHVGHYAQAVAAAAVRRRGINAAAAMTKLFWDEATPLDDLHQRVQSELDGAMVRIARRSGTTLDELMSRKWESLYDETRPGICTGYRDLDEVLGGLQRSDLIILAARPAVGKTALALGIAEQVAQDNRRVQVFSLEMSDAQLGDRLIAGRTGIDTQRIRLRQLRDGQLQTVAEAMGNLAKLDMRIEDDGVLTINEIRARAIRNASVYGSPDLIVIDYLQLMSGGGDDENRVQEVGKISRGLKQLARELNVPILALSQLSRAVETRASKVPMLSDLRESGSLEQDADVVLFIYREELYEPETDKKGIAEIHIAKHRNGPVGVIPMRFDASTTKFSDLSYRTPEGY